MGFGTRARMMVALLCAMPLAAQTWDDLRVLKPGDVVKVQDTAGKELKGTFRAVTAEAISIATGNREMSIERARVKRVQVRSGAHRLRHALIGAGIGAAVGLVADQTLGAYLRNELSESGGARALTYIAPIGLFSAIAAIPPGYRTVYRVR